MILQRYQKSKENIQMSYVMDRSSQIEKSQILKTVLQLGMFPKLMIQITCQWKKDVEER